MIDLPEGTRGLIFDCDGTLADTMPIHRALWDDLLVPHGVDLPKGYIDHHSGKPTRTIVQIINDEFGKSIDAELLVREKEYRFLKQVDRVGPIDPVVATARSHRGKLPMGVVSGGVRENVVRSLTTIGTIDWFDVILTADDPIAPKPAPDLFLAAADRLAVPPSACHAFEDADAGIEAARAAGMSVTDVREHWPPSGASH